MVRAVVILGQRVTASIYIATDAAPPILFRMADNVGRCLHGGRGIMAAGADIIAGAISFMLTWGVTEHGQGADVGDSHLPKLNRKRRKSFQNKPYDKKRNKRRAKAKTRCFYCNRKTRIWEYIEGESPPADTRTKDHVIPQARGGKRVVNCCLACNQEKANLSVKQFADLRIATGRKVPPRVKKMIAWLNFSEPT